MIDPILMDKGADELPRGCTTGANHHPWYSAGRRATTEHARATATIPVWPRLSLAVRHQGVDPSLGPARIADRLLRLVTGSCCRSRKTWAAASRIFRLAG